MEIVELAAGRDRSLALLADGGARIWGAVRVIGATLPPGYPGELCLGEPTEIGHKRYAQPVPHALLPGQPLATLADGTLESLAVLRTGIVLACRPVLAKDEGATRSPLGGLPPSPLRIATTDTAAFALYADGSVWSWGLPAQGQLGRVAPAAPGERTARFAPPARIEGLPPMQALATGSGHVLALDRKGQAWSWGANAAGQLGRGSLRAGSEPQPIALPAPVRHVAAGATHSLALDTLGRLHAWGSNNHGQLGLAGLAYADRPRRVQPGFSVGQVDGGVFHTVATSTAGDVFTWGWNGLGQLGDAGPSRARPGRVAGLAEVKRLSASHGHVLALGRGGLYAWGDNRSSACGQPPSVPVQAAPVRIAIA